MNIKHINQGILPHLNNGLPPGLPPPYSSSTKPLSGTYRVGKSPLNLTSLALRNFAFRPDYGSAKLSLILAFLVEADPSSVALFRLPFAPPPRPPFTL
jgi:hypothetical protein